MGRKKPAVKKGKAKSSSKPSKRAATARTVLPPSPEPYVPNWGDVDPDLYENLLEWVDVIEID